MNQFLFLILDFKGVDMEENSNLSKVAMYVTRGCLVVPIQGELYDESVIQMQNDILKEVSEKMIKGVVVDLSAVVIMDSFLARALCNMVKMNSMLGAVTVLTGFKPEAAASIVDLNLEFKDIQIAVNIEEGFQKIDILLASEEETLAGVEEGMEEEEETVEDTEDEEQE
jgi:rsbT antagonist protein RsbS